MQVNFSTSINIIRDYNKELQYIPTPNSDRTLEQIKNDFQSGFRAFNIVGSYGTGKSAFLLEFERFLNNEPNNFGLRNGEFKKIKSFKFINIIGEFDSPIKLLGEQLGIRSYKNPGNLIKKIEKKFDKNIRGNNCLVLVIDEFGKYLEFCAKNNPEKEIYFIQQLVEFVNNTEKNILLLTSLHQNFSNYARGLESTQKFEWEKVKGRFKEIAFNEPVEQLLYIASEFGLNKLSQLASVNKIKEVHNLISSTKILENSNLSNVLTSQKLFPLDLLSAYILTLSLQRYGQNERSLFTFLMSNDFLGINNFDKTKNEFYNVSCIYDYLSHNLYNFLNSTDNADYTQWNILKSAIFRVQSTVSSKIFESTKLVKLIALADLFLPESVNLDKRFIESYSKLCLGIKNPKSLIDELEHKRIIRYVNYKKRFVLAEGTDFNLDIELKRAKDQIKSVHFYNSLQRYVTLPITIAKAEYLKKGTPRFFEYLVSSKPIDSFDKREADGVINLIINGKTNISDLLILSKKNSEPILYCHFKDEKVVINVLDTLERLDTIIKKLSDDKEARKIVNRVVQEKTIELNNLVIKQLYNKKIVTWIYNGKIKLIKNQYELNNVLSKITSYVYNKTPIFNNELINRHKLPPSINKARKDYFVALLNYSDKEDLGFSKNNYPPEKTIYLSLLKENNIHVNQNGYLVFEKPTNSFKDLWETSESFLNLAKNSLKPISDFVKLLSTRPFSMKKGFIDFWVPTFLFIQREDYALFNEDKFIPELSVDNIDLLTKYPERFYIKTFNIDGIKLELFHKYREIINKDISHANKSCFIETIKPFLSFYKTLPEYSKNTNRLSKKTLALREAIAKSKDLEKTFFVSFPNALGFDLAQLRNNNSALLNYVENIRKSMNELRLSYEELINRIESHISKSLFNEEIKFPELREKINLRYSGIKEHLLLSYQRTFLLRLRSDLDNKTSWISSFSQVALEKGLESLTDNEEDQLFERLSEIFTELDNLLEISKLQKDIQEAILKIDITLPKTPKLSKVIRYPKNKNKAVVELQSQIVKVLSKDESLNTAVLANILKEKLS